MPWRIGIGSGVVVITYAGLIAARPDSVHGGVGGPAALLTLCAYTLGAMLIASGPVVGLPTAMVGLLPVAIAINIMVGGADPP
ncbi:hypothetical protein ACFOSC_00330 [Streptantibioticus rubrisoli]|uniref:Uncharacterized protein n=1 Tax=Streptantibioticus rubrisoli TaxID=1387313 RepID=A0ABT1PIE9_9ACTN|nr:hypothetical protein [Streptantibioticus rubrisoli]MCQ4045139.1 hypothetical protein [Streptantibioticus rubrisoli]